MPWWGVPGGPVIKNLPANAGNMGSNPGLEGSHLPTKQLSLQVTTTEALVPRVCSTAIEVATMRHRAPQLESSPCSLQLEKSLQRETMKTQLSQK